ncbi:hypothetical protein CTA2_9103 [Colletotrichum tanaceti]|uniref:Ricin B lectin n=1 Tax=Colletotrichum tanaceti TaxID=1306861 RepID=A0A4U6XCC9_9PEZI|nr:hypothetical protein CTA2_9103 [Colletotrichum tanaceti]TKW53398.1 hypothetical protein CTA1_11564 [Colletotrichum tanaceti]
MKFSLLAVVLASASTAQGEISWKLEKAANPTTDQRDDSKIRQGEITWKLEKAANPTADQRDAYSRIEAVMKLAVARHARLGHAKKSLKVYYKPGVATAEAHYNGDVRFGSNRSYMTERTALHEISHTLGVGQTPAFRSKCASGNWTTALPLLRSWGKPDDKIECGGMHFWPYGLNYEEEWSESNANRHVQIINAMLADGM